MKIKSYAWYLGIVRINHIALGEVHGKAGTTDESFGSCSLELRVRTLSKTSIVAKVNGETHNIEV